MRSRSKIALWAVVSMVFFATVSARPLQGGDDKDVAKPTRLQRLTPLILPIRQAWSTRLYGLSVTSQYFV